MRTALGQALGALLLLGGGALAADAESPAEPEAAAEVETSSAVEPSAEAETSGAGRPPYELTRSLQALQDQIALGSEAANSALRALLVRIGDELLAANPEVWREPANARAAIVFTLGGGRPHLLHRLIREELLPAGETELAKAALAYATGRRDEAWSVLETVDARTLPPALGAHIALVQGGLTADSDPASALGYLETARLLAPGTLVEEAALRRQLSVASALSDAEGFMALARQYVRRFPNSVFAVNFLRSFPELWAGLDLPSDADTFAKLEATVAGLASGDRRKLYLALAFDRVVAGEVEIARLAATGASGLADAGSAEASRAALYEAAAGVAGRDSVLALEALEAIDPAALSEPDAELHAAALAVAEEVQRAPEPAGPLDPDAGEPDASEMLERGRAAVAAADALLEKMR